MTDIPLEKVQLMIRQAVAEAGSQVKFAKFCGVPKQTISVMLQGLRPNEKILAAIGIERVVTVTYRRKAP